MRSTEPKTVALVLTCAVVVDGQVMTKGAKVELSDDLAENLCRRGKAELASAAADAGDKPPPAGEQAPDLASFTKAELLEKAAKLGVEVNEKDTKAQILAALQKPAA